MIAYLRSKLYFTMYSLTMLINKIILYIPSLIYDLVISEFLTIYSYTRFSSIIKQTPQPKNRPLRILDIGVGTAYPLFRIWSTLPEHVDVLGVDYDHYYVVKAQRLFKDIAQQNGNRKIELKEMNFYSMNPKTYGKFDIIVFSSSFMLMPFHDKAIELAKELLEEKGKIYFILTLQHPLKQKSILTRFSEYIKPKMKYLTTIDFGRITYEDEFEKLLQEGKLQTTLKERLKKRGNIPTHLFRGFLYETQVEPLHLTTK